MDTTVKQNKKRRGGGGGDKKKTRKEKKKMKKDKKKKQKEKKCYDRRKWTNIGINKWEVLDKEKIAYRVIFKYPSFLFQNFIDHHNLTP